ncbi:MAG: hypothetical protein M3019_11725 [Candidatus Dormibacteraeota bacterium]|nr:hypothetical protein [Candidatus Dormibacteraeota bacterium]
MLPGNATARRRRRPTNRAIFVREIIAGVLGFVAVLFWRSVPIYDLALFPAVFVVADLTSRIRAVRTALIAARAAVLAWGAYVSPEGARVG